jgi:metacaspase-1
MFWWKRRKKKIDPPIVVDIDPNRTALFVTIGDYPGTEMDLQGCINDGQLFSTCLANNGFSVNSLVNRSATISAVKSALTSFLLGGIDGGVQIFFISSHGTSVVDTNGDESDARDEAFVLYDGNLVDDELQNIITKYKNPNSFLLLVCDCCHSGTMTRSLGRVLTLNTTRSRYLPPIDSELAKIVQNVPIKDNFRSEESMNELLITGCRARELSFESKFGNITYGALTYYLVEAINSNIDVTYEELMLKVIKKVRKFSANGQNPQLEGSIMNKKRKLFQ